MPPARNPATMIMGSNINCGIPPSETPRAVAVKAPASSCPSAPMFQNLALNANATANPVIRSGLALTKVSNRLYRGG